MHEPKRDVATLTVYELALKSLREDGPMTAWQLAEKRNWPLKKAKQGIARGRNMKLIGLHGKTPYSNRFIYAAAHVPGWPQPAPDTVAP
jgi:hypothetical protein